MSCSLAAILVEAPVDVSVKGLGRSKSENLGKGRKTYEQQDPEENKINRPKDWKARLGGEEGEKRE